MNDNHARFSPALVETIAGLSAGTISTLAVHPLDVIKTRLQIHRNTSPTPASGFAILRSLLANQNQIRSLYRGLTPNLVGNASSWAIFFYFKSIVESQLLQFHNRPSKLHDRRDTLSPVDYFVASGISGTLITISTNPIWVLKTRMLSSDKGSEGAYDSMWHGIKRLFKEEGVRGFYKGTGISLIGNSHGAIQFAIYEPAKRVWKQYAVHGSGSRQQEVLDSKLGNTATLVISGFAKIAAGAITYPYQVIRSRLQTYHAEERYGSGIRGVTKKLWGESGWRGFYRGLGTNIVRVLPATWVTFLVYENSRFYLRHWANES